MRHLLTVALTLSTACGSLDDDVEDSRCDAALDTPEVTLTADDMPTFQIGAETVEIRGTARHELGLAIRRITIAGLDATSDSFNFAAWSFDVPADLLEARLPSNVTFPATVVLPISAYAACGGESTAGSAEAHVRVTQ